MLFGDTAETAEALRSAIKKARGRHRTALEKATEADLAQLDSGLMLEAMDKYYGLRYPSPATLLDHLDTPLFILDEVGGIRDAQKDTEFRRSEELTGLLEEGVLCPGLDVLDVYKRQCNESADCVYCKPVKVSTHAFVSPCHVFTSHSAAKMCIRDRNTPAFDCGNSAYFNRLEQFKKRIAY